MNYRLIISEDHLAHHGILGQKWGVRRYQNKDGTLTAAGKKRYANEIKEAYKKERFPHPYYDTTLRGTESLNIIREKLSDSVDELKKVDDEASEMFDDYYKNIDKYSAISGMAETIYNYNDPETAKEYATKGIGNIITNAAFFTFSDGDQSGGFQSAVVYAHDKKLDPKKILDLRERSAKLEGEIKNKATEYTNELLGAYGSMEVPVGKNKKMSAANRLVANVISETVDQNKYLYALADYDGYYYPKINKSKEFDTSITEAKKIYDKLPKAAFTSINSWSMLNKAIIELGYDGTPYEELTDSDWSKINKAVREI